MNVIEKENENIKMAFSSDTGSFCSLNCILHFLQCLQIGYDAEVFVICTFLYISFNKLFNLFNYRLFNGSVCCAEILDND